MPTTLTTTGCFQDPDAAGPPTFSTFGIGLELQRAAELAVREEIVRKYGISSTDGDTTP